MKTGKVIGFVLSFVMAVLALWLADGRFTWRKVFRAQSSFVLCDSAVTTNAAGKMVLPQCRRKTGTYQDLSLVVSDGLKPLLRGGSRMEQILRAYLQAKSRVNAPGFSITNAFESAEYRRDDGLVDRLSGQVLRVDLTPKGCECLRAGGGFVEVL